MLFNSTCVFFNHQAALFNSICEFFNYQLALFNSASEFFNYQSALFNSTDEFYNYLPYFLKKQVGFPFLELILVFINIVLFSPIPFYAAALMVFANAAKAALMACSAWTLTMTSPKWNQTDTLWQTGNTDGS